MPTCRYGWSLNTTRMSISAMFGREPALRCPVWKPSIVSDAPRMQIVGEGRARVAGSDKVHDGVVRRANVELEFLAGRHLLEHFHSQLEVARLAPGSYRLIGASPQLRRIDRRQHTAAAVEHHGQRPIRTNICKRPIGAGRAPAISDGAAPVPFNRADVSKGLSLGDIGDDAQAGLADARHQLDRLLERSDRHGGSIIQGFHRLYGRLGL